MYLQNSSFFILISFVILVVLCEFYEYDGSGYAFDPKLFDKSFGLFGSIFPKSILGLCVYFSIFGSSRAAPKIIV